MGEVERQIAIRNRRLNQVKGRRDIDVSAVLGNLEDALAEADLAGATPHIEAAQATLTALVAPED